jgi:Glyoxalase/Bleomycin resistance protein/Dioxygenase superfamily
MDRVNHIKIITPEPEAIDRFLTEVLEVPAGWLMPGTGPSDAAPVRTVATPAGSLSWDDVVAFRGGSQADGYITGSERSVQFQVYPGERPHIWGIAVGTRKLEQAYERCVERGIPCTDVRLVPWTDGGGIRAFFAEVGGIVFEVLRVEPPDET